MLRGLFVSVFFSVFFSVFVSRASCSYLAEIKEGYPCEEAKKQVNELSFGVMGTDFRALEGPLDCFVRFDLLPKAVEKLWFVESVVEDTSVSVVQWGLDRIDQEKLPLDNFAYSPPYDGSGVDIYVLDTGIYAEHNDFSTRAKIKYPGIIKGENGVDRHGHGTHCASTAGGSEYGVAPGSRVFGVQVLNRYGSGSTSGVIDGIQKVVGGAVGTSVLSLSLGGSKNRALDRAVMNAAKRHIVVVAAGNANSNACNYSPGGASGAVVTVGATTERDTRASFSNYGKCVDMYAPGTNIVAAGLGSFSSTKKMSGTSMACPHVAGVAAQVLQKNGGNLRESLLELRSLSTFVDTLRFVQIPRYTGPPTLPTLKPTTGPTLGPLELCGSRGCVDFSASTFGPPAKNLFAPAVVSKSDFCKNNEKIQPGSIVLIKRGGCMFYTKVKNAEAGGAVGVLIYQDSNAVPFPPNYGGDDDVKIPSAMIERSSVNKLKNETVRWARRGSMASSCSYVDRKACKEGATCFWRSNKCHVEGCWRYRKARICRKKPGCSWAGKCVG